MEPKYKLIAKEIKEKIILKEYLVGEKIPTEAKLMNIYEVSRHTIRQAIALLVNDGLLRSEKGSGTYVISEEVDTKKIKKIGVIVTYLSDYIFPSIIRGIENELTKEGYILLFSCTNNDIKQEKECLKRLFEQEVDGVIIEPTKSNEFNPNISYYGLFKEKGIPVVTINAKLDFINLPSISLNDVAVGYKSTNYLIEKGLSNIACIQKIDDLQGKLRLKGYIQALEENKRTINSDNIHIFTTENKNIILDELVKNLVNNDGKIDGIVCYNDEIAYSLIKSLEKIGRSIPRDISVIGQDNSTLSKEISLTTLTHPKETLGRDAALWMISSIEDGRIGESIEYYPELIERETVI